MNTFLIIILVVVVSILFLKGFDKIAGRGSSQIKKGIDSSNITKEEKDRIPCPECAEMIKKDAKKCYFCGTIIKNKKDK